MPNKEKPIINPADFNSIKLNINLINTTTQAEIRDGKRCYSTGFSKKNNNPADENLEILISEFLPDGLVLEIPTKTCASNHNILIEIHSQNATPEINFSGTMKVNSHEKISLETDLIEASFLQKDEQEWKKIQKIFQKRQDEIRNFINSVKGFEST